MKYYDIKKLYSINKDNLLNLKLIYKLSRPTKVNFNDLNRVVEKKKKTIVTYLNSKKETKINSEYWNNIIRRWLISNLDFIIINYKFLVKKLPKNKIYKIYKIDGIDFANYEHSYINPEKFTLWLAGEYIKFKKYKFIQLNYEENKFQKKFNKLFNINYFNLNFKRKLFFLFNFFFCKLFKSKFLIDYVGLNIKDFFKLNFKLKQFPYIFYSLDYKKNLYNKKLRQLFLKHLLSKTDFDFFINKIIVTIFPKIFLEDFYNIKSLYLKKYHIPKILITENTSHPLDKQIFISLLKNKGVKILVTQHGGNYGTAMFGIGQQFDREISDNFLTWGWKNNKKDNKFISLRFSNNKIRVKANYDSKKILFLGNLSSFYINKPYYLPRSAVDSFETINVINNLSIFLKEKKHKIVFRYLTRIQNSGFYINKKFYNKNILFDRFDNILKKELNNYKLTIHEGFSGTTYLETIAYNFPTIIYMNKKNQIFLSSLFRVFLKDLIKAKIVHTDIESLKNFLKLNLFEIENWWNSKLVRKTINVFKKNFVNTEENYVDFFKKKIQTFSIK